MFTDNPVYGSLDGNSMTCSITLSQGSSGYTTRVMYPLLAALRHGVRVCGVVFALHCVVLGGGVGGWVACTTVQALRALRAASHVRSAHNLLPHCPTSMFVILTAGWP